MLEMLKDYLVVDFEEAYPEVRFRDKNNLIQTMKDVFSYTKCPFVILIDEWDCLFREYKQDKEAQKKYLDFLQQNPVYRNFARTLNDAGGEHSAKLKKQSFVNAWVELSKNDVFNESQHNFIVDTHLKPLINAIKEKEILRLNERHPVVKDVLYSMSVQHGKASKIVNDTLEKLKLEYGGDLNNISDDIILRRLYQSRADYVQNLKESCFPGDKRITREEKMNIINNRYPYELRKALDCLK